MLRSEHPPDRPFVIVAGSVVADHGEADRDVQVGRCGGEGSGSARPSAHRRRPGIARAGSQTAEARSIRGYRAVARGDRPQADARALAQRPRELRVARGEPDQERPARERRALRLEQVEVPVEQHGDDRQDAEEGDDPGSGECEPQAPDAAAQSRECLAFIPRLCVAQSRSRRSRHPSPPSIPPVCERALRLSPAH